MIKVSSQTLSPSALRGVIEAFVLREGTDYGHKEFSLDEKCAAVARRIDAGEVEIWFDPVSATTDLRPAGCGADTGQGGKSDG